jgi:hypothetical protein
LRLDAKAATAHYDHTGAVVADVRVGEDAYGGWVAGAVRPSCDESRIREFMAAPVSGDWRQVNGSLELVGLLAVNVPGYPVPRPAARVAAGVPEDEDARLALVAAGVVVPLPMSERAAACWPRVLRGWTRCSTSPKPEPRGSHSARARARAAARNAAAPAGWV